MPYNGQVTFPGRHSVGTQVVRVITTTFFAGDILAGFLTISSSDGKLAVKRRRRMKQHLGSWFLLDLASLVPIDMILHDMPRWNALLRLLKFPFTAKQLLMSSAKLPMDFRWGSKIRQCARGHWYVCARTALALMALGFVVHLQACVWAVLQTTERQQPPYTSALMEVLTALVSLGYRVPYNEQTLALQIFEVVLALERLSLACALIELCVSRGIV